MNIETASLLDVSRTIARELFIRCKYPWEAISQIKVFILTLGAALDPSVYELRGENVWVARSSKVFDSAYIGGPCIIDEEAEVRQCAFIRSSAVVGKNAVVGNSTEIKNAVLFDRVQVPHYNYVGDSILGYRSHMGAGAVTSNVKNDKTPVKVKNGMEVIETGLKKFGAVIGDFAEVGCQSVLNPGTVIGRNTSIYPLSSVRGVIEADSIFKSAHSIVRKY